MKANTPPARPDVAGQSCGVGPRECEPSILLVEDDATVRSLVAAALHREGFAVTAAGDAATALRLLKERAPRPALLVTDVTLPDGSGVDLAIAVRSIQPELKVLLTSGHADARPGTALGFRFLPKPFSTSLLVRTMRTMLGCNVA